MTKDDKLSTSSAGAGDEDVEMKIETASAHTIIKLSPFWPSNPNTWFDSAELQFSYSGRFLSDQRKFMYVLQSLSPEETEKVSDIIRNPPATNQYQTLKDTILNRLAPSQETQLETLLTGLQLGDQRPSDLLRRIKSLAGAGFPSNTIKTLWLRRLPELLNIALIALPEATPLDELAKTADRIGDAMNRNPRVASINTSASTPGQTSSNFPSSSSNQSQNSQPRASNTPTLKSIAKRLDTIEARLNGMFNQRGRNRSRSTSRNNFNNPNRNSNNYPTNSGQGSRSTSVSRTFLPQPGDNKQWCTLHNKFGFKAHYCTQPCTFLKDKQGGSSDQKND